MKMEEKEKKKFEKLRCPQCGGYKVRTRLITGEHICERCAFTWGKKRDDWEWKT